jgi:hypothetical protein
MKKFLDRFQDWFLLRPEEFGDITIELKVKCQTNDSQKVKAVKGW